MHKKLLNAFLLMTVLAFAACTSGNDNKETTTTSSDANIEGKDYLVTIKTDFGEMKAVLHDLTPNHKENFIKLAGEGFFDELLFHRVKPQFMIQGGDPSSKGAPSGAMLGGGSPGYEIDAEITPELFHRKGALAAARTPNPERRSNGSQFYIVQGYVFPKEQVSFNEVALSRAVGLLRQNYPQDSLNSILQTAFEEGGQSAYFEKCLELKDEITAKTGVTFAMPPEQAEVYSTIGGYPFLDGQYTVFGQVIDGLDVIDKIAVVQTVNDRPIEDVKMYISVEEMSKSEIASKYNYTEFQ